MYDTDACSSFGRGEGAVAIVLKPLEDAIRDHDHIYATVSASSGVFYSIVLTSCRFSVLASTPLARLPR